MIRETLDAASKYAYTFYEPSSIIFFDRTSSGEILSIKAVQVRRCRIG